MVIAELYVYSKIVRMTTKLTLSLDSKVIESAKRYSQQKGKSLSRLIEDYLKNLTMTKRPKRKSRVERLSGILGTVSDDFDYKKELTSILREKHLKNG